MAKKNKTTGEGRSAMPAIPQKDLYQRINFAVQASTFLQSLAGPSSSSHVLPAISEEGIRYRPVRADRRGKRKASTTSDGRMERLAMDMMRNTKKMAVHTQLRLDPSLKRSICNSCGTIQLPGLTARIRNRPDKRTIHACHTTCLQCMSTRSLPNPPTHSTSEGLDGISRRKRRERVVKRSKGKVEFHERERAEGEEVGGGHTLWQDGEKVHGWGAATGHSKTQEGEEE